MVKVFAMSMNLLVETQNSLNVESRYMDLSLQLLSRVTYTCTDVTDVGINCCELCFTMHLLNFIYQYNELHIKLHVHVHVHEMLLVSSLQLLLQDTII